MNISFLRFPLPSFFFISSLNFPRPQVVSNHHSLNIPTTIQPALSKNHQESSSCLENSPIISHLFSLFLPSSRPSRRETRTNPRRSKGARGAGWACTLSSPWTFSIQTEKSSTRKKNNNWLDHILNSWNKSTSQWAYEYRLAGWLWISEGKKWKFQAYLVDGDEYSEVLT